MFIKLVRLGADGELRNVGGKSVLNISVVYDVGYGDKKASQWMRLALWGDRADKVASHMTKGKQLVVRVDDLKVTTFEGKNGTQASLEGTLTGFDFVSDGNGGSQRQEPAQSRQEPVRQAASGGGGGGVDDDLPF